MCEPPGAADSCEEPSAGTEKCSVKQIHFFFLNHAISATISRVFCLYMQCCSATDPLASRAVCGQE